MGIYGYCVNLEERGEFFADLRNAQCESIWEIRVGPDEDIEDVSGGYMLYGRDVAGLERWLKDLKVIEPGAVVMPMMRFEEALSALPEEQSEEEGADADEQGAGQVL